MSQHEGVGGERLSEPLVDPRAPWEEPVEDPSAPRKLLAVLFTDIVGSTELATALGDKRWRELLEQHDAAVREQLARFGGTEVDTAGDAFFATFERPVQAVDCALEAMRAVRRLGLRIRAGVHMGECVVSNGKVRGVSVHIGARVAAKARGSELLISSTVHDILAGAGLTFLDRGEQILKGVDGRWRLLAVEPRERDTEADLPPLLEREHAKPSVPWWKRKRIAVAGVTALAVLAGTIAYVTVSSGGASRVPADSVALIDAASGDVESSVGVSRRPVGLAVAPGGVWVANSVDGTVTRVTTSKGSSRESKTTKVGVGPFAVAAGGGAVWVANGDSGNVSRIDADSTEETGNRIQAGNGLSGIAYSGSSLWLSNATDGTVWQVEPTTGNKTREIAVGPTVRGLVATDDAIWVASETAGTVTQIGSESGVIVRVIPVGRGPVAIAARGNDVWVANRADGTATRVDASTGRATVTRRVGRSPHAIAIAGDHVFIANEESATVTMLDARSGRILRTIALGNAPMGLAATSTQVWVSVRGGILNYRGGTLKLGMGFPPRTLDPTAAYDPSFTFALTQSVYDGLTAFKKVGGPEGNDLVPNLAEEIRPPTDNGTTYTFTLRAGLVYSDGTPVLASDVRSTFERSFLIPESYGGGLLSILRGADKCSPEGCDLSDAIVTDDRARTIVFHLRTPFADFPYYLALPSLVVMSKRAPRKDALLEPIAGTGPYRIARVTQGVDEEGIAVAKTVVLERNTRFAARGLAQPDGYADRIEFTLGVDPNDLVKGIRDGRFDMTPDGLEAGIPVQELATELPAQTHVIDMPWNAYIVMNTAVPPFNNVKARKALNFVLDRKALVEAKDDRFSGDISCQVLPKNTIGFVPYCPYTKDPNPSGLWVGPDLATARRLVRESGTLGQHVTVWTEEGDFFSARQRRARGPIVADALRKIGYEADVRVIPGNYFEAFADPNNKRQVGLSGWASDYAGAANFVLPLLTCPQTLSRLGGDVVFPANISRFCAPSLDRLTEDALQVQLTEPASARDRWAAVDKAMTDAAVLAPWANLRNLILASRRAGNVQGHAAYTVLVTQIWVVQEPKPTPS